MNRRKITILLLISLCLLPFKVDAKTIKEFIKYFNNDRLAYALNYKSPIQYRTELGFN